MKSCKKITAAVLAAILAFSLFICPAFAGTSSGEEPSVSAEADVTTTKSAEELTYYPPTLPETEPETRVTATGTDKEVLEKVSLYQQFLDRINELFNIILEAIQKLSDILSGK